MLGQLGLHLRAARAGLDVKKKELAVWATRPWAKGTLDEAVDTTSLAHARARHEELLARARLGEHATNVTAMLRTRYGDALRPDVLEALLRLHQRLVALAESGELGQEHISPAQLFYAAQFAKEAPVHQQLAAAQAGARAAYLDVMDGLPEGVRQKVRGAYEAAFLRR